MSNSLTPKPRIIGPKVRVCIVASKYNEQFTDAMVENAIQELGELVPEGHSHEREGVLVPLAGGRAIAQRVHVGPC